MKKFSHFVVENLSSLLFVLLIFSLSKTLADMFFHDSVLVFIFHAYLLVAFVENSKGVIFEKSSSRFVEFVMVRETKKLFDYSVLFVFILTLYYLISLPLIVLEFTNINMIDLGQSAPVDEFSAIVWIFEGILKSIYQGVFIYSISSMAVYKIGVIESLKKSFYVLFRTKNTFGMIVVVNCALHLFYCLDVQENALKIIDYIWSLIFPTAILLVMLSLHGEQRRLG